MELDTGVPVANTTPRPPVSSSIYRHFINISEDFCASEVERPATLRIFVNKKRFLKACASSTNSRSTPSCSKVITSSFRSEARSLSSLACRLFRVFSICLMVKDSPASAWRPQCPVQFPQSVPEANAPAVLRRWGFSQTGSAR